VLSPSYLRQRYNDVGGSDTGESDIDLLSIGLPYRFWLAATSVAGVRAAAPAGGLIDAQDPGLGLGDPPDGGTKAGALSF
jgi:hypothetical protein